MPTDPEFPSEHTPAASSHAKGALGLFQLLGLGLLLMMVLFVLIALFISA